MSEKQKTDGWLAVDKSEFLKDETQSPSLKERSEGSKSSHQPEHSDQNDEPAEQNIEEGSHKSL